MAEDLEIRIKTAIDAAGSAKSLGELKKSIKDLKGLALQAGEGTAAFGELTSAIGKANDKLGDLNDVISAQTGNRVQNLVGAFSRIGTTALAGFQMASGAMAAFGNSTEGAVEEMRKLQGFMSMTMALQQLAGINDTISQIGNALKSSLLPIYQTANAAVINLGTSLKNISWSSLATGMDNFFTSIATGFGNLITGAGKFFTAIRGFMASNPLGLLLIAITGVISLLSVLVDDFKPVKILFDGFKAIIGSIIQGLKDFTDWLGVTNFAQKEASKSYIKTLEKEKEAIEDKWNADIKLAEAAGKETKQLQIQRLLDLKANASSQLAVLQELKDKNIELNDEQKKSYDELKRTIAGYTVDIKVIEEKKNQELGTIFDQLQNARANSWKEGNMKSKEQLRLALEAETREFEKQKEKIEELLNGAYDPELMTTLLSAHNAKVAQLNRDFLKGENDRYKDYLAKKKAKMEEQFQYELGLEKLKEKKLERTYENEIDKLKAVLLEELKDNSARLTAKENFHNSMMRLADGEMEQDKKIFEMKIKNLQEQKKLEKAGSLESKKIELEILNTKEEYENQKIQIKKKYRDQEQRILEEGLATYLDLEGRTLAKTYTAEKIAIEDRAMFRRRAAEDNIQRLLEELRQTEEYKKASSEKQMEMEMQIGYENMKVMTNILADKEQAMTVLNKKYKDDTKKILEDLQKTEIGLMEDPIEKIKEKLDYELKENEKVKDKKLKDLQEAYDAEKAMGEMSLEREKQFADTKDKINKEYTDKKVKLERDAEQEIMNIRMEYASQMVGSLVTLLEGINDIQQQKIQQQLSDFSKAHDERVAMNKQAADQETQNINDNYAIQMANFTGTEEEKNELQKNFAQQKVARENELKMIEYNEAVKKYKFEEDLRRKGFEQNKKNQLAVAVINGALAVTSALATVTPTWPTGVIAAAAAAISAGVQIAKIASTQYTSSGSPPVPPVLANPAAAGLGGGGSTPQQKQFSGPTAPAFFGLGQATPNTTPTTGTGPVKVYVLENDITDVQRRVSVVESRATTKI